MCRERAILSDEGELYDLASKVIRAAAVANTTLGCAESCTGGLVCGCLTAVPGSSSVIKGSVVSYAIPVKHEVLGVEGEGVLDAPGIGAVSGECASQMAQGARRVLSCHVGVSVTGIAGPGGEEPGKPVGTVWFGLSTPAGTRATVRHFEGSRREVRSAACRFALGLMYEGVMELSSGQN